MGWAEFVPYLDNFCLDKNVNYYPRDGTQTMWSFFLAIFDPPSPVAVLVVFREPPLPSPKKTRGIF